MRNRSSVGAGNNVLVIVLLGIGNHGLGSGLPAGRADLAVGIHILESLDQS